MTNNYSENIFQAIDTIVSQRLNEVSFDRTEICTVIEKNKEYPDKYWVSNESGLKFEAYTTDKNKVYIEKQKVYVTIPQGNYELRKLIIGSYSADELPKSLYVNPFNHLVTSSTISFDAQNNNDFIICAYVNNNNYDEWTDSGIKNYPNTIIKPVSFSYNIKDLDYIGLDFAFKTDISGYTGSYALQLSFWNEEKNLTPNNDNLIISSKNLYGNPYNLTSQLSFQHLFPWPTEIEDITKITHIQLKLIQDNNFQTINNTDKIIKLVKADLKFGYDIETIAKDELQLYLQEGQSLMYTTGDTAAARTLYLDWKHLDTSGNPYIFNNTQLPDIFENYSVYWLHYVDGLGQNVDLPNEYAWNWETIAINNFLIQDIVLTTLYRTDQYKAVIKYKYRNNEKEYYAISTGIVFNNTQVAAEPGASNSSEETLRIKLDEGDTGVYNIYGLDGRMIDTSYKSHNIHFEFLDLTPLDKIASINWEFPTTNTMIKDVANIDQQIATFNIDAMYKPGAMNNRIWCTVTLITGEIRQGSLTLQFGEVSTSGSNYAFNIDFKGHRTCIYAKDTDDETADTIEIIATFTKQNGEIMTVPTINWSWKDSETEMSSGDIELLSNTGSSVEIKYDSTDISDDNFSILQATITDYPIDNGLNANLTAYLPIPIAKKDYSYISGATRVVYDSNGNTATYSKNPYKLYSLINEITDTSWDITPNPSDETINYDIFQLKTQNIRDEEDNIIGEEKTLLPLSYIPQDPPSTCVYCKLGEDIVWSQPILIMQNRWEYNLLNEWNGKLTTDGSTYTLAPLLGAGKKENNTFTGVIMGDLKIANSNTTEQTGLYGFKAGVRRFSFNDEGEAYIGTGDYYIDFSNSELKINTKIFNLNANHLTMSSISQDINIYSDSNNTNLRVKIGKIPKDQGSDVYGLDIYDGAFRLYGTDYSSISSTTKPAIEFSKRKQTDSEYTMYISGNFERVDSNRGKVQLGDYGTDLIFSSGFEEGGESDNTLKFIKKNDKNKDFFLSFGLSGNNKNDNSASISFIRPSEVYDNTTYPPRTYGGALYINSGYIDNTSSYINHQAPALWLQAGRFNADTSNPMSGFARIQLIGANSASGSSIYIQADAPKSNSNYKSSIILEASSMYLTTTNEINLNASTIKAYGYHLPKFYGSNSMGEIVEMYMIDGTDGNGLGLFITVIDSNGQYKWFRIHPDIP